MSFMRRKRTTDERSARLARAEWLQAHGVPIEIPKEWRENWHPFDVMVAPPGDCVVWDRPNGGVFYVVYFRMFANQSGLRYPSFEMETSWDDQIVLESVDENKSGVEFGGQWYPQQEILNPRIEDNQMLPRGRIIFGCLLATGLRPIPAEHGNFAIVPFDLTLRDQSCGDIIQTVQGQLSVSRCRYRLVALRTGLYGGGKPELSPGEESSRRYRELLEKEPKPQFREPLSADQRFEENMRYAALQREEKAFDAWSAKVERQQAKARQSGYCQEQVVVPTPLAESHKQNLGSGTGHPSPPCVDDAVESSKEAALKGIRKLNLLPETQAMFENMIRSCP